MQKQWKGESSLLLNSLRPTEIFFISSKSCIINESLVYLDGPRMKTSDLALKIGQTFAFNFYQNLHG